MGGKGMREKRREKKQEREFVEIRNDYVSLLQSKALKYNNMAQELSETTNKEAFNVIHARCMARIVTMERYFNRSLK